MSDIQIIFLHLNPHKNFVDMIKSLILLGTLTFCMMTKAERIAVDAEKIPDTAQDVLKEHFEEKRVLMASYDTDKNLYSVILIEGQVLKFNEEGCWTLIDCKKSHVPFLLVPKYIRQKISQRYGPYTHAIEILKTRKHTFVKLDNGVEMIFPKEKKHV